LLKKLALQSEEEPQRLKSRIDFVALTARLEASPFQNKVKIRVFAQIVKSHPFKVNPQPERRFKTKSKS
jgi:hypothetical protein